nr:hypothetical protein Iba_chr02aCG22540 [Ipomoea batatas]
MRTSLRSLESCNLNIAGNTGRLPGICGAYIHSYFQIVALRGTMKAPRMSVEQEMQEAGGHRKPVIPETRRPQLGFTNKYILKRRKNDEFGSVPPHLLSDDSSESE